MEASGMVPGSQQFRRNWKRFIPWRMAPRFTTFLFFMASWLAARRSWKPWGPEGHREDHKRRGITKPVWRRVLVIDSLVCTLKVRHRNCMKQHHHPGHLTNSTELTDEAEWEMTHSHRQGLHLNFQSYNNSHKKQNEFKGQKYFQAPFSGIFLKGPTNLIEMTGVTTAAQRKAVCGPLCLITNTPALEIPPDVTTEETERALTASCLT